MHLDNGGVNLSAAFSMVSISIRSILQGTPVGLYKVTMSSCTSFSPFSFPPLFQINSPYLHSFPLLHFPVVLYSLPLMIHILHGSRAFTYSVEDKYSSLCTCTSVIWLPHANTELFLLRIANFTGYWAPHTLPTHFCTLSHTATMSVATASINDTLPSSIPKLDATGLNWAIFSLHFEDAVQAKASGVTFAVPPHPPLLHSNQHVLLKSAPLSRSGRRMSAQPGPCSHTSYLISL